ncbi:MAG: hypothetical protein M3R04_02600, partial [bacterium]|nr:hypothetical protein [bacterium]
PKIRAALLQVVGADGRLDTQTMRWAAATINCIICLRGWLSLTEDWDMDTTEASEVTAWAAHLIISGIRGGSGSQDRKPSSDASN